MRITIPPEVIVTSNDVTTLGVFMNVWSTDRNPIPIAYNGYADLAFEIYGRSTTDALYRGSSQVAASSYQGISI